MAQAFAATAAKIPIRATRPLDHVSCTCPEDYRVSGGKCVARPTGTVNAAGDKISDGDSTCDFPDGIAHEPARLEREMRGMPTLYDERWRRRPIGGKDTE